MSVTKMVPWLAQYPLSRKASILCDGFSQGFWIPFVPTEEPTMSDNLTSAARFEFPPTYPIATCEFPHLAWCLKMILENSP